MQDRKEAEFRWSRKQWAALSACSRKFWGLSFFSCVPVFLINQWRLGDVSAVSSPGAHNRAPHVLGGYRVSRRGNRATFTLAAEPISFVTGAW